MWRVAILTLAFASLAGCAGSDGAPEQADDTARPGVLRGVVVDNAIQPMPGASVVVSPGGAQNSTDAEGRFEFAHLETGVYTLEVSLEGYLSESLVATVEDKVNPVVKVVLTPDPEAVKFVTPLHFQGFVECAAFPFNWCAQANIASIILCEGYGVCLGDITGDRSLALHWLDGVPDFLQTEMVWKSSNAMGEKFLFVIGGMTREELASGTGAALNTTRGPSPLMMQLDNATLAEHSIGGERALMTQLHPSPQEEIPGGCVQWNPCGPSFHALQDYEYFTHAFYGYEPPEDWLFAEDGPPPGP